MIARGLAANGDVAKLKEAFHQDAWMMGHLGAMDTYFPVAQLFATFSTRKSTRPPLNACRATPGSK